MSHTPPIRRPLHNQASDGPETGLNRLPYRDFATLSTPEVLKEVKDDPKQPTQTRAPSKSRFPIVLHRLLEQAPVEDYENVISWCPHGRAFIIHQRDRFTKDIMPTYFRHQSQFASFQRQLNLYGFLRLTRKGPDRGSYYHELFLRGRPSLCHHIHRLRINGNEVRQSTIPEMEPDFAALPPVNQPIIDSFATVANAARRSLARSDSESENEPTANIISGNEDSASLVRDIPSLLIRSGALPVAQNTGPRERSVEEKTTEEIYYELFPEDRQRLRNRLPIMSVPEVAGSSVAARLPSSQGDTKPSPSKRPRRNSNLSTPKPGTSSIGSTPDDVKSGSKDESPPSVDLEMAPRETADMALFLDDVDLD
ncbi:predicted protein [Phaeodactylum tricornutum CCAP 1055/1]|uniref:HSF-type DNA-binding domain-containing protein n=1 Tax=Phaeodactylum tricornutum (strain CCAP 1055/1) TaxID=556484 RepID=B7G9N1_PHATC|nr:predicted protein [Phaeodactylum tricornutum CCAP 1055/1]EEC44591.1 predicted protein [Phaeodactylum tricornutum CCAP 1055/1]|eukprot:XP_002183922.1 predicted protein [Phaeodactylum tricornutum CCAP 1055/1]